MHAGSGVTSQVTLVQLHAGPVHTGYRWLGAVVGGCRCSGWDRWVLPTLVVVVVGVLGGTGGSCSHWLWVVVGVLGGTGGSFPHWLWVVVGVLSGTGGSCPHRL